MKLESRDAIICALHSVGQAERRLEIAQSEAIRMFCPVKVGDKIAASVSTDGRKCMMLVDKLTVDLALDAFVFWASGRKLTKAGEPHNVNAYRVFHVEYRS
jgi:hypothetical protein